MTQSTGLRRAAIVAPIRTAVGKLGGSLSSLTAGQLGATILKALGIRNRGVRVVSCPSCARQGFDVIRTVQALEERLQHIRTPMSLSVLGCVVNGPGEARETDIGLTGGGNGKHMVYLSGVTDHVVQDEGMIDHIVRLVEAKAAEIEAAGEAAKVAAE